MLTQWYAMCASLITLKHYLHMTGYPVASRHKIHLQGFLTVSQSALMILKKFGHQGIVMYEGWLIKSKCEKTCLKKF